jgi:hypothetical protein
LAGGAVVWAGHKLSKKDAEQIEEHTGKPPDDLSDEEVEAAMNELGLLKLPNNRRLKTKMDSRPSPLF